MRVLISLVFFGAVVITGSVPARSSVSVTTYHYDNLRTGWNNNETTLTPNNVKQTTFGILRTVTLDDQVDAQPLFVHNQTIAGATHDVVYVATENNTIYAIGASTGTILVSRNLGSPVSRPLSCHLGPDVGIDSTPVIDLAEQALYVIAYVKGSPPSYQLHALNLSDLKDKVPPVTVAASHVLTNGSSFSFNATVQRQRPGLVEVNGNVYAGFGSFCDFSSSNGAYSRGWLLGWKASNLAPLPGNQLNDTQATSPTNYFLSSIWMSGYGIAATGTSLYFTTGNSDCQTYNNPNPGACPATTTYNGVTNIQESVVGINPDLVHQLRVFTPSNVATLDKEDNDLGAGGVLLVPPQPNNFPLLAVISSKDGRLFLLNRNNYLIGGVNPPGPVNFTPGGPDNVLDEHQIGGCWCGPSFFTGPDGIGRIVTSGGNTLKSWQLVLTPSPHLQLEGAANIPLSQQDPDSSPLFQATVPKLGQA